MSLHRKTRFFVLLFAALLKKQYLHIFLGLFLGIFFYFSLPFCIKHFPQIKPTLKIGLVGQWTVNEIPEKIQNEISLGLTSISKEGEIVPSLAENWEVSDEGRTYRFKIKKEDFFWHDKKKFFPSEINYNFKDVIVQTESNDVIFKLKDSFSPFPFVVSKPIFKKGLVGVGRYQLRKINWSGKYIKSIVLVPFSDKKLPKKTYKFYSTEKELKIAFGLGEINIIEGVFDKSGINLNQLSAVNEVTRNDAYLALFFDVSKPVFRDKSFRQALAYAISKEKGQKRALGPINPLSWANNPDIKPYEQDLAKAKSLLGKEKNSLESINLVIFTFPQYRDIAEEIKKSWAGIGIKSEVQVTTFLPASFDVLLIAREIPNDPDQYYFWHSTQAGNLSKFENPRIDKLLEDGRKTIDKEKRKDIYYDFQRFLVEESPVVFLTHPTTYFIARNENLLKLF